MGRNHGDNTSHCLLELKAQKHIVLNLIVFDIELKQLFTYILMTKIGADQE